MTEYEQEIGRWKDQLILLIIVIVSTNIGIKSFKKRFPLASQKQHCIDELTNISLSFRKYFFRSAIPLIATSITLLYFHHLSLSYNLFFQIISFSLCFASALSHTHPSNMSLGGKGFIENINKMLTISTQTLASTVLLLINIK